MLPARARRGVFFEGNDYIFPIRTLNASGIAVYDYTIPPFKTSVQKNAIVPDIAE